MKPENERVVKKTISIRANQVNAIAQFVDINRYGQFSQFVQDAIDERVARISRQGKEELKAS
jgi:hypothetical protein